jgi:hypothetical protein
MRNSTNESSRNRLASLVKRKIGVNRPRVKWKHRMAYTSAPVPEQNASRPSGSAFGRFLRSVFLLAVLILLALAGVLFLFNRPFSESPKAFRASRMTSGNLLFPVQVAVFADHVARHKPRFFGHTEDSISTDHIASVKVQAGVVFADVVIDTTGGSPPVVVHGLWKKDAEELSRLIGAAQAARRKPAA